MNILHAISISALVCASISMSAQTSKPSPVLKGDYLGQTPPGDTPVVFAPGIISTLNSVEHGFPSFSPDGDEVFWQTNRFLDGGEKRTVLGMSMRRIHGEWTAPRISPYDGGPVVSPDGKRLYFLPVGAEKLGDKNGPYYVEKTGQGWSEPKCLGLLARFPELKYIYNQSIALNGTLYFIGHAPGLESKNKFGIYRAKLIHGEYAKPELLPSRINAPGALNWTPFIAPDESYLLFSSDRINAQQGLFLSFRQPDGSWTEAVSLGAAINTRWGARFPAVSPDGKYLFFTRWVSDEDEDVFWVSSGIINRLKANIVSKN